MQSILGYALIQLPDLFLAIYRHLKKAIGKHTSSISEESPVTVQNNANSTSPSSPDKNVSAIFGDEGRNTTALNEIAANKLHKPVDANDSLAQTGSELSKRMDVTDNRLYKIEELVGSLIQMVNELSQKNSV